VQRFFHGYHDTYCYLPLYVFCGRHLLVAKLRPANIDVSAGSIEEVARIVARIRQRWPKCAFCCVPIRALLATR
jgi:Transposase DDE domain group 1